MGDDVSLEPTSWSPAHLQGPRSAQTRIGETVIFRLSNGSLRSVKLLTEGSVTFGKLGSLTHEMLVGLTYGLTYEVEGESLVPAVVELIVPQEKNEEGNNQFITYFGSQAVTPDEIERLREEGITGRVRDLSTASLGLLNVWQEMIVKQMTSSASFDQRTSFSKQKYIARKEAKYLKLLTPLPPTLQNICDYFYSRTPSQFPRVHALRVDTLAQILSSANIQPGSRFLVIDDTTSHLLTGAILSRMGGSGRVLLITDADNDPPLLSVPLFNLTMDEMAPLRWLHWANAQPDWSAIELPRATEEATYRSAREKARIERRTANMRLTDENRRELFEGEFDALVIATAYDAVSIVSQLTPYLTGSAQLVATSSINQPLLSLSAFLRDSRDFIAPTLTEPFLRRYQVLPGRTHPDMNGMQHGGFVLHALRVLSVDVELERPKRAKNKANGVKRKRDEADKSAQDPI